MSEKRRGLGRGLGALIPPAPPARAGADRPVDVFFPGREEETENSPTGAAQARGADTDATDAAQAGTVGADTTGTSPAGGESARETSASPSNATAGAPAPVSPFSPGSTGVGGSNGSSATPSAGGPQGAAGASGADDASRATGAATSDRTGNVDAGAPAADGLVPVPGAYFAELPTEAISPNPRQPRQVFDEEELAELVQSVKEIGVLQPVVVRPSGERDGRPTFELIMGERRWRATRDAGLERIPAIVRETSDDDLLRDALLEHLHRSQLNPLEEAAAYQQLLEDFGCTHEELASRIGRSRPQISNTIRLLRLPPVVQRRLSAGVLSAGHARALLGLENAEAMDKLAQRIVNEGMSVRATEEAVAVTDGDPAASTPRRRPRPGGHHGELDELATRLADRLDTRVSISLGRSKGKLSVEFASVEDLNRILEILAPEERKAFQS